MARVLYLSFDGVTDPLGQSQVFPYLKGIVAKGHEITLISFEKRNKKHKKGSFRVQLEKSGIQWHPFHLTRKPPMVSTLWDLFKLYQRVSYLNKKKNFDFIHCRSYLVALVALLFKRRKGIPFLLDIRGFWIDKKVEEGKWDLMHPFYRIVYKFFRKQEKAFFQEASAVISLTHIGKKVLRDRFQCQLPIFVIPCMVNTDLFNNDQIQEEQRNNYRKSLGLPPDRLVLSFLGSIGTWYLLPEIMHFFSRLLLVHPKAIFLLITREKAENIYKTADQYDIPHRRIMITRAEHREVPILLSLSNFSIFFTKPTFSKQASSPTKQGEIMSMGLPLVSNKGIGDTGEVLEKYNSGIMVEGFTEESYDAVIHQLNELLRTDPQKIREGAIDYYALEKGIEKYHEAYELIAPTKYQKK